MAEDEVHLKANRPEKSVKLWPSVAKCVTQDK
jgi:hypothetical protein